MLDGHVAAAVHPGRGQDRRRHRPQRAGALPALPAPRLQAEPMPEELLVRVPVSRLALRPARHQGRRCAVRPAPRSMDRFSIAVGPTACCRRHRQDHARAAADRRSASPASSRRGRRPAASDDPSTSPSLEGIDDRHARTRARGQLPARRARARAAPARRSATGRAAPVERFSSPPSTRTFELTAERAAQVVRQSSNARWVGFLAVIVVILFVAIYWFYELGSPRGLSEPRLKAEVDAQQVTSVERGYNLYEANCARCHGANGEGGIGPALNRQEKLFAHLSEDYLKQHAHGRRPIRLWRPELADADLGRHGPSARTAELQAGRRTSSRSSGRQAPRRS